jgi:hypothetical protein
MKRIRATTLLVAMTLAIGVNARPATRTADPDKTLAISVRSHMEILASDAMLGRGSATLNEVAAANYIAGELKRYGIEPAGDAGGFIQLAQLPAGVHVAKGLRTTVNVVGVLRGSDPKHADGVILLSAHLDHLGIGAKVNGDGIYNGADDDASGVCAVLELARILGNGPRPRRTVLFVLFGSEELGSLGALWFRQHPPLPMREIVANLEFEMIGREDAAVPPHTLWLTGYERSNLGPALAQHGARLVADPHPAENFFARSDNYGLARQGIVAHTVSSFGLHGDYHQPSDEIARIDFIHMNESIASLVKPVEWLVDSDFKPSWNAGGRPQSRGSREHALLLGGALVGVGAFRPPRGARVDLHAEHGEAMDAAVGQAFHLAFVRDHSVGAFDMHVQHGLAAFGTFALVDHVGSFGACVGWVDRQLACLRCAASNAASCSGVASLWYLAFHSANGIP